MNPATKQLTWPGTGVAFTFTGTSATIHLASVSGSNSVDLFVDGGAATVIPSVYGTSISTPPGLSPGIHTVELRKRSEASLGTITISGVTITNGSFRPHVAPTRQIEIIGDSITVGYGLDGTTASCTNTAAIEDNPKTYGALAATSLDAAYSVIAYSGIGLTRNYADDGQSLIPELWTRYGESDADDNYTFPANATPDAVVVNIGTNDFNYLGTRDPLNPSTFVAAYVKFIQTIWGHYPNAHFFLMTSPLLSDTYPTVADAQHTVESNALKCVIAQLGDAKIYLVDWPTQGADVGCDYHPNAATHAAEAPVLAAAIKSALGW